MGRKGRPTKNNAKMSVYEKRYARMLYARGQTQQQIADVIGYTAKTVNKLKQFEGDWEESRLPLFSDIDVLTNLKEILFRLQTTMTSEADVDLSQKITDTRKLVLAISHMQELIDDITMRDMQIALKRHIEWMAVHEATGSPVEIAQQHYDWCQDHL